MKKNEIKSKRKEKERMSSLNQGKRIDDIFFCCVGRIILKIRNNEIKIKYQIEKQIENDRGKQCKKDKENKALYLYKVQFKQYAATA